MANLHKPHAMDLFLLRRSTYHAPGLCPPQLEDIRALNEELKFRCPEEQLKQMTEMMSGITKSYQRVSEMRDPSIPLVKYPRTAGYRPDPEDNPYNAWAWRCEIQGAPTGKLAGRTVAIKDNTAVAGVPMRNGTKVLDGYIPEFDATVVSRILDAGGRVTGKSAVEDMCFNSSSVTSSDGPVRNPHEESRITGGSSSGSAALVAGGQVDMAIGGDQGGSIRIPASFTGIVALKPTWGLVPYTGASSMEPTVDHLGPMTKTVTDCALLLEVIAGYDDGRDPRQIPNIPIPEYSKLLDEGVSSKKIGLLTEGFELCTEEVVKTVVREAVNRLTQAGCVVKETSIPIHKDGEGYFLDEEVSSKKIGLLTEGFELCTEEVVKTVVREAVNRLTQAGCVVKETSIPMHKDGLAIYTVSALHGMIKFIFQCRGTGYFNKDFNATSLQEATFRGQAAHPHDLSPLFKYPCLYMSYIDRLYGNKFYAKGQNLILELTKKYDAALEEFDVLVMPTSLCTAPRMPPADCSLSDLVKNSSSKCGNVEPFDITGHPALSINAGFSAPADQGKGRLPIGMMIVGKKFDEVTVLQVARAFEKLSNEQ